MVIRTNEKDDLSSQRLTDFIIMMKIIQLFSFLVVFNFISAQVTFADGKTNVLSFDHFSQMNGLPNNQIQCILHDKKGWIWLGTSQGLSRFDGYRFVNFVHIPEDTTSLSGNLVRVIFEDSKGTLLVGTENGGLNVFDREKERFLHPYKNISAFKSGEISVNTLAEDPEGILYIGTDRSLLKVDNHNHLTEVIPVTGIQKNSFSGSFVRVIQFDNSGSLWIGTNNGLFQTR
jgi:ligand-binding sensor domain-containing protein